MSTPVRGLQESPYVLYDPSLRWDPRGSEFLYSFHHGTFPIDVKRESALGPTLDNLNLDPDILRQAKDVIRQAMAAWEQVCGIKFVEVDDHPYINLRIGSMAFSHSDGPGGTLGAAWRGTDLNLKALIVLDPYDTWDETLLYDVMLHELGHALGIRHSNVYNAVMSGPPYSSYWNPPGRNVLQPDDIAAAQ